MLTQELPEEDEVVDRERKTAMLLLGHGSKVGEANRALYEIAAGVKSRGGFPIVEVAFLQLAEPLLEEGFRRCVAQGAGRILLIPYFLYLGAHVGGDIPQKVAEVRQRYPGVEIVQTEHLGTHPKLVEVVLARIAEAEGRCERGSRGAREQGSTGAGEHGSRGAEERRSAGADDQKPKGREIEDQSYEIIRRRLDGHARPPEEMAVVMRAIHATADFAWERDLLFHPQAVARGVEALRNGRSLVSDVNMVRVGIREPLVRSLGGQVRCRIADAGLAAEAGPTERVTRAALGIREARGSLEGGVVVIGNAPTALEEVLRLAGEEGIRPALVIGVPVGLVGAAEAKEALFRSGLPFITNRGGKGGTPLAVSIVNALLKQAAELSTA